MGDGKEAALTAKRQLGDENFDGILEFTTEILEIQAFGP